VDNEPKTEHGGASIGSPEAPNILDDDLSLDDVPLDVIAMPPLKRIIAGDVTPEEHARAIRLDQLQRVKRWRRATLEERGRAVAELMDLVSAMDRFPPQQSEFPGFPGSLKRRHAES
jgi:hypothetical protein